MGYWFETHWRQCVVFFSKTLYPLSIQETSQHYWTIVDRDINNQLKSTKVLISLHSCAGWSALLLSTTKQGFCVIGLTLYLKCLKSTKVLISLHSCAGWSAFLLFEYNKTRVLCDRTHFIPEMPQINKSADQPALCRLICSFVVWVQYNKGFVW